MYAETARVQYAGIIAPRDFAKLSIGNLGHRWAWLLASRKWVKSAHVAEEPVGTIVGFAAAGPCRWEGATCTLFMSCQIISAAE